MSRAYEAVATIADLSNLTVAANISAEDQKKIAIVAEGGFDNEDGDYYQKGRNRAKEYEDIIKFWASKQQVGAYLIWAFQPKSFNKSTGNDDAKLRSEEHTSELQSQR